LGFVPSSKSFLFLEMATNTIDTITSILTQKELYAFCSTFNIPADLRPEFPGPNDTIKDSSEGKIGINTHCIEFANFRILLSKFLLCVFQYYQINFSKLPVLAATKISRFEIMCRVLGSAPTVGTFRRFYFNSISNGWLSFSKRSSTRCFSKNLDSLKNWNNHFFWIDASVCPIFVPWYNDVSVKRDPLPSDDVVDLPLVDELNENRTLIRTYPEVFLSIIGLSRTFVDTDIRHTLIGCDKNGLIDFVKSADVFKVKTIQLVDHTIIDESREVGGKKKRKVGFSAGPPPLKKARAGGIAILEPNPTTAGKTLAALKTLGIQGQHDVGFGSASHPTKDFVSTSVTVTPERECHDESGLTQDGNVRTRPASDHFVVLTSNSEPMDVDATISSKVISPIQYMHIKAEVAVVGPCESDACKKQNGKMNNEGSKMIKKLKDETLLRRKMKTRDEKLEKVEAELRRARVLIRDVVGTNHSRSSSSFDDPDYVLTGSIYRNPEMFHTSYLLMEKLFKVYIYQEGEPPLFHTGPTVDIYSMEGVFLNFIENDPNYRISDPDQAHVYFLPFSVAMILNNLFDPVIRDKAVLGRVIGDYLKHYVLPFSDVLNWDAFSVPVSVSEIPNLKKILLDISDDQYKRLQENVKNVQRHFLVNYPVKRYDVYHMILHSLWLRRLNLQIYG
nr:probable glycosyltransferase At3g07620 [Tanacetum cinerariifolium]